MRPLVAACMFLGFFWFEYVLIFSFLGGRVSVDPGKQVCPLQSCGVLTSLSPPRSFVGSAIAGRRTAPRWRSVHCRAASSHRCPPRSSLWVQQSKDAHIPRRRSAVAVCSRVGIREPRVPTTPVKAQDHAAVNENPRRKT